MAATSLPENTASPGARLRLMSAKDEIPLTSRAKVRVKTLNKKGAVLLLKSPFIDGCHVLMDVHNITPVLAQVSFTAKDAEDQEELALLGGVTAFDQLETSGPSRFILELAWQKKELADPVRRRRLKSLIRMVRNMPDQQI